MISLKKILAPYDFSSCSEEALTYAVDLALQTRAELHLVVAEVLHEDVLPPDQAEAVRAVLQRRFGEDIEQRLDLKQVIVRDIAAAPALLNYAAEHDVDMIVMGTHGRRGLRRVLVGSVAEEVVRLAPCPVLTVREFDDDEKARRPVRSILVPIDFSSHAREALQHATALAGLMDARIDLLHVIEDRFHPAFYGIATRSIYDIDPDIDKKARAELRALFEGLPASNIEAAFHVRDGHPVHEIVAFAEEVDSDLIVMSTHGLTGMEHFLLGSVTEKVVRRSPVPVLTVKAFGKSLIPPSEDVETAAAS